MAMHRTVAQVLSLTVFLIAGGSYVNADEPGDINTFPKILTADPLKAKPGDDELHKLRKSLYNERQSLALGEYKAYIGGHQYTDSLLGAARRLMKSGLELSDKRQDKVDFLEKMQGFAKKVETLTASRPNPKGNTQQELDKIRSREFALEVDIELLKLKKEGGSKKD